MNQMKLQTWKKGPLIESDNSRVLLRPFVPGNEERIKSILDRVMRLSDSETEKILVMVKDEFADRHRDLEGAFEQRFGQLKPYLPSRYKPSRSKGLLIGSYFTCEYSLEGAALFNPSIVQHPDQTGVETGSLRFIMSLRATGEGHISSIEFRAGVIDSEGNVRLDMPNRFVATPQVVEDPRFDRPIFENKLVDQKCLNSTTEELLRSLPKQFKRSDLKARIARFQKNHPRLTKEQARSIGCVESLLEINYEMSFQKGIQLSERVVFPVSSYESNGIEDARFVRFLDDDGTATYYATYTAYNGRAITPLLLETADFTHFRINSLSGGAAKNKGMALFPRKIGGKYAMISRHDGENLFVGYSNTPYRWNAPRNLVRPTSYWEYTQIGNCGSPIETERGWLLLTHGVGPVRKYCIGAVLLERENPSRVIGQLPEPLITPDESEREGYVPNVVYTCGAILRDRTLVIPYAMSDYATRVVTVSIDELLRKMR